MKPAQLRSRVRNAMMLLATIAVLLFGLPLAIAVQRTNYAEQLSTLQRDATRGVAAVPDNVLQTGRGTTAPQVGGSSRIAVYDARGQLVAGAGPRVSGLAAAARDGREHSGRERGELVVAAPVLSDVAVAGSVRAAVPLARIRSRTYREWAGLAGLALVVLVLTYALSSRSARRVTAPFDQLAAAVRALGSGSFEVRLPRWGLQEADAAAAALHETARQMEQLVTSERDFVKHASHQLRTPLSGLLLQLEQLAASGSEAGRAALERAQALQVTLDDLLLVRSDPEAETCDAVAVATEMLSRHENGNRAVVLRAADVEDVAAPAAAVRQALDVLLDNAIRHGAGTVTVTVEPLGHNVVIEVADEGAGLDAGALPGTGLRLATSLMHRFGGELLIRRRAPRPRIALLLQQAQSPSGAPRQAARPPLPLS